MFGQFCAFGSSVDEESKRVLLALFKVLRLENPTLHLIMIPSFEHKTLAVLEVKLTQIRFIDVYKSTNFIVCNVLVLQVKLETRQLIRNRPRGSLHDHFAGRVVQSQRSYIGERVISQSCQAFLRRINVNEEKLILVDLSRGEKKSVAVKPGVIQNGVIEKICNLGERESNRELVNIN